MDALMIKAMVIASGNYLTQNFPDNFNEIDDDVLDYFMLDNAWEPIEDMPVEWVYEQIEIAASAMVTFAENNQDL